MTGDSLSIAEQVFREIRRLRQSLASLEQRATFVEIDTLLSVTEVELDSLIAKLRQKPQ